MKISSTLIMLATVAFAYRNLQGANENSAANRNQTTPTPNNAAYNASANATANANANAAFMAWAAKNNRYYTSNADFQARQQKFLEMDAKYQAINNDTKNTFKVGHNFLSDMLPEEIHSMLGYNASDDDGQPNYGTPPGKKRILEDSTLLLSESNEERNLQSSCKCPASTCSSTTTTPSFCTECNDYGAGKAQTLLDWRTAANNPKGLNAVQPVQNQGQCGSCWAFAVTAAEEIQNYITNPVSVGNLKLSEQLILDCNTAGYNCGGGSPLTAIQWLAKTGTMQELASDYPYKTAQSSTCGINQAKQQKAVISSYTYTKTTGGVNVQTMIDALSAGPVVTHLDASSAIFQGYQGGIINNPCCYSTTVNHAVLTVGWGISSTNQAYWIIRNTWGTGWGENGYVRIAILTGGNGVCGNQISYETVQMQTFTGIAVQQQTATSTGNGANALMQLGLLIAGLIQLF